MVRFPNAETPAGGHWTRVAGSEPLPGYVLIEPLGRGGFGEVWKCEVPGGLHKAIKFIAGDPCAVVGGEQIRQEWEAFESMKRIRHPFLITLERVEQVGSELIMIMELADRQLEDRFAQCRRQGLEGIPRGEALSYLLEAAEALDYLGSAFGLQHLDVKPANLFLIAGHVKVGDYGQVGRQSVAPLSDENPRGVTPRYVAPEVLRGRVDNRSDQYSLALVYYELVTGGFPYAAEASSAASIRQHLFAPPDLSLLPGCERAAVGRALSKSPEDRFPNCVEFVWSLLASEPSAVTPAQAIRRTQHDPGPADPIPTPAPPSGPLPTLAFPTLPPYPHDAVTLFPPPSITRIAPSSNPRTLPSAAEAPRPPSETDLAVAGFLDAVVPIGLLLGEPSEASASSPREFAAAVLAAAANDTVELSDGLCRRPDGTWVCTFPTTIPAAFAPTKLERIAKWWNLTLDPSDSERLVLRKVISTGVRGTAVETSGGLELVVRLSPPGRSIGAVMATGSVTGNPDARFARQVSDSASQILSDIRLALGNVTCRRKMPRIDTNLPVAVYPVRASGRVNPPIPGRCRDVSAGGVCVVTDRPLPTARAYVAFETVPAVAGLAILVRIVRNQFAGEEFVSAGPYLMDPGDILQGDPDWTSRPAPFGPRTPHTAPESNG